MQVLEIIPMPVLKVHVSAAGPPWFAGLVRHEHSFGSPGGWLGPRLMAFYPL